MQSIFSILNHNWVTTVLGGLLVIFFTPLVTGFAEFTFRSKSWEVFGISNGADTPGSYLSPDAVYRVPLGERFRLDEDLLLSVFWRFDDPYISLTRADGRSQAVRVSVSKSIYLKGNCKQVAVHLMRTPMPEDLEFFLMYTAEHLDQAECKGLWERTFR